MYLSHMVDAATLVDEFVRNRTAQDFATDQLFRSGVYYQLAIIGEALSKLREIDPSTASKITDARQIIGFRNQIIHGYAVIDDDLTWQIIQKDLPILKKELALLLSEA